MKKINRLILVLALLTINSFADEKVKMKEPVELVFDTKVSCKDMKPYLEFIEEERKRNNIEAPKIICSNDDTDGKLTIVDKDTDKPKIIHEPTNTVFSELVQIGQKLYGLTANYKVRLSPKAIAYADLDDDGVNEIFIADYSKYGWFGMEIIKNNDGQYELFNNSIKVDNGYVVVLSSKTKGFHDILFKDDNRKRKNDAIWKYVGNLKYGY